MSVQFSELGSGIVIQNNVGLAGDLERFVEELVIEFSEEQLELSLGRVQMIEIEPGADDFQANEGYDLVVVTFSFKHRPISVYSFQRECLIDVYVSYKSEDDFVVNLVVEWEIDT